MDIHTIISMGRQTGCSDIHISEGLPMLIRVRGALEYSPIQLTDEETREIILHMPDERQQKELSEGRDVDFAIQSPDGGRERVNIFRQQGKLACTVRLLNDRIPTIEELRLPPILKQLADEREADPCYGADRKWQVHNAGSMIDYVNASRPEHIITIEDPVEYVYERKQALIHQREVGRDVDSFAAALRSALREDPDIILVGEMRDYETISAALTAAETGHLVLSTLHTTGAAQTIDRIIDACPASSQNQVRIQLSGVLKGVVTQCLIPTADGRGRIAATEVLTGTDAVMNLIRESKGHQMATLMQSGAANGMHTLNGDLSRLVAMGVISGENAFKYSNDKRDLTNYL